MGSEIPPVSDRQYFSMKTDRSVPVTQLRDDKQREKEEEGKKQKEDDEVNRKLEQQQLEVKMRRQLEEEAKRKETEEILAKLQRRNEELMQSEDELRRMLLEDINCTITNACYLLLSSKEIIVAVTHGSGNMSPASEPILILHSPAPRRGDSSLFSLFLHFIIHLLFRHRKDTIAINRYSAHYERDADG
ncbi:hypothetical protein BLNAU_24292 [Blattamonas nauphoetae]|uniref:Uncharacterized protein n=1 Tax=Blattamonas nauphoetae TaxID=2049346 RepID=A0ABQ9WMW6_9EUKA|nr:hypothetical protein BLNAU_24292 [Blattamonas nauphoetae]